MPKSSLLEYGLDAVALLRRCIELYDRGETVFYRVMAVELRLLLCDTTRRHDQLFDLSLAPRLAPELALPALDGDGEFTRAGDPLPLALWLEQEIPLATGGRASLRQLIRKVCDQDGGAHVDQRPGSGLAPEAGQSTWMRKIAGAVVEELEARFKHSRPVD